MRTGAAAVGGFFAADQFDGQALETSGASGHAPLQVKGMAEGNGLGADGEDRAWVEQAEERMGGGGEEDKADEDEGDQEDGQEPFNHEATVAFPAVQHLPEENADDAIPESGEEEGEKELADWGGTGAQLDWAGGGAGAGFLSGR